MSATVAPRRAAEPALMTHRQILEAMTGLLAALFTALLSSTIVSIALPTIIGGPARHPAAVHLGDHRLPAGHDRHHPDLGQARGPVQQEVAGPARHRASSWSARSPPGSSQTVPSVLAFRVVQGVAMGGLIAVVQSIMGSIIAPRERGRYSGYMGAVMAVSTVSGPLLGGVIIDTALGWRWCFFVCVPLAVISLVLLQSTLHVPTDRRAREDRLPRRRPARHHRQPADAVGDLRRQ